MKSDEAYTECTSRSFELFAAGSMEIAVDKGLFNGLLSEE